jgi:hypothetical protein
MCVCHARWINVKDRKWKGRKEEEEGLAHVSARWIEFVFELQSKLGPAVAL